jgi:phage terminase large subunit-like protein
VKKIKQADGIRLYGEQGWQACQDVELFFSEGLGLHPYPWQSNDILYPIFGNLDDDGLRQTSTAYVEIPKKNGKSLLGSGIALWLLTADGEEFPHVVSAAGSKEQAKIVFNEAVKMVEGSEYLSGLCRVFRDKIEYGPNEGIYEAISAEAYTKHGPSYSGVIFDEVHTQPNQELWDVTTPGIMARKQGLVFGISTAGTDKTSLCYGLHERAIDSIKDPASDPTFFGRIYTYNRAFAWDSEEAFASCNPSYGLAVKRRAWLALISKAKRNEANQAVYRQLHLNEWVDWAVGWIPPEVWFQCS